MVVVPSEELANVSINLSQITYLNTQSKNEKTYRKIPLLNT